MSALENNARDLAKEFDWFTQVLDTRLKLYFGKETTHKTIYEINPPTFARSKSVYADFIRNTALTIPERLVLLLALIPHVKPELLDVFYTRNSTFERGFSEFGGHKGIGHGGFLPTGETAMFLLSGGDFSTRFAHHNLFEGSHRFSRLGILFLEPSAPGEPFLSGMIRLSREFLELFTTGNVRKPNFNKEFPAKLITTSLTWSDLVLPSKTMNQLDELTLWMEHSHTLMEDWGLAKKIRPGYRGLFHGPPGTGKTMTACLLGERTGRDVYRIDLSMVISKYIGETEENLARVFNMAENKSWVLFFDEADALFGSRVKTESSNDMFANQQVSYLLQRIEDFNGMVILSSNLKSNIDEAFIRRFESMIHFSLPKPEERLRIWRKGFSEKTPLEEGADLRKIATAYELSGGAIMNAVRYASLMAVKRKTNIIRQVDIEAGVRREYSKEGRTFGRARA